MSLDMAVPAEFEEVRDEDERILWVGKPDFNAFMLSGAPFLVFGLLWGAIDCSFISMALTPVSKPVWPVMIPFFALHLFPLWLGIGNMVRLGLVHGNTAYAITTKRLMMRSGFWGTDFKSIDYDKISDIEVKVNPIENALGVGTIQAFSGRTSNKGVALADKFVGISDPYAVFKRIKEVSVDIKTDWHYPNALRPTENPGYNTEYREP